MHLGRETTNRGIDRQSEGGERARERERERDRERKRVKERDA